MRICIIMRTTDKSKFSWREIRAPAQPRRPCFYRKQGNVRVYMRMRVRVMRASVAGYIGMIPV